MGIHVKKFLPFFPSRWHQTTNSRPALRGQAIPHLPTSILTQSVKNCNFISIPFASTAFRQISVLFSSGTCDDSPTADNHNNDNQQNTSFYDTFKYISEQTTLNFLNACSWFGGWTVRVLCQSVKCHWAIIRENKDTPLYEDHQ